MNTQDISKEWIDTFNHLGSEGKLNAPVNYNDIFNMDELFGKKLYTFYYRQQINVLKGHKQQYVP